MKHNLAPGKLLWLDLEMTGLNPAKDLIVEVGVIITDWEFNEIASFESGVWQKPTELARLFKANPWAAKNQANTKALQDLSAKSPKLGAVEQELNSLIEANFAQGEPVLLAGNSIHQDRRFIRQYLPQLEQLLHYRMLDVSAWKVLAQGKFGLDFKKSETHRALQDIRESIAELKFYLGELPKIVKSV